MSDKTVTDDLIDNANEGSKDVPAPARSGGFRRRRLVEFAPLWKKAAVVSAVVVTIALLGLLLRGLNLGIEFEGGQAWEFDSQGATTEDIRNTLEQFDLGDARIQEFGESQMRVRAEIAEADIGLLDDIRTALAGVAGISPDDVSPSAVGASWGGEITRSMFWALAVFGMVIFVYITVRLEWKMAVGALAAVFHDIIITIGIYALFQFEVTAATVIALLTILGYSLYDTLIVFDKIRENESRVQTSSKLSYSGLVSHSLNQVLTRSINTTITSVLPVLAVLIIGRFILGAITLQEFAIALLVGLIVGTYSSLFVATPIVAWLKEKEPANIERRNRLEEGEGGTESVAAILAEADRSREVRAQARSETRRIKGVTADGSVPKSKVQKSKVTANKAGAKADKTAGVTEKAAGKAKKVQDSVEDAATSAADSGAAAAGGTIAPKPRKKKRK